MRKPSIVLALLLAVPAARADVLVVDAAGGGDFTTLSAAVAAAHAGDTLLVKHAEYVEAAPVVVDGKALTIVGDSSAALGPVSLEPGLEVRNLPAGKQVILQNLGLRGANSSASGPATAGLVLRDNTSHVRVQDCILFGGNGQPQFKAGGPGLEMVDTYSAALIDCSAYGGFGNDSGITGEGGPGAIVSGGQLLLSQSNASGGTGGSAGIGGFDHGGQGGTGLLLSSGTLLLAGAVIQGGDGGVSYKGGDGGIGLLIDSGSAWLLGGSNASGGDGGRSDNPPDGKDGADFITPPGAVTNFGGTVHGFFLASPLREGQVSLMQLSGHGNEKALIFISLTPHQLLFPGYQGVLMLSPTALVGPFIVGPPGNQLVHVVAPMLPSGLDLLTLFVQPAFVGTDGVNLGTGRVLTVLDSSF